METKKLLEKETHAELIEMAQKELHDLEEQKKILEMALEELLVEADRLDRVDRLAEIERDHPVDQQRRGGRPAALR